MTAADPASFVAVITDCIDFNIECVCGYTCRNVAADEAGARRVADEHEALCEFPETGQS